MRIAGALVIFPMVVNRELISIIALNSLPIICQSFSIFRFSSLFSPLLTLAVREISSLWAHSVRHPVIILAGGTAWTYLGRGRWVCWYRLLWRWHRIQRYTGLVGKWDKSFEFLLLLYSTLNACVYAIQRDSLFLIVPGNRLNYWRKYRKNGIV